MCRESRYRSVYGAVRPAAGYFIFCTRYCSLSCSPSLLVFVCVCNVGRDRWLEVSHEYSCVLCGAIYARYARYGAMGARGLV